MSPPAADGLRPLGFPQCARCPLLAAGDPVTCASCVATSAPLSSARCSVCSRALNGAATCGNPVCSWPDRSIGVVHAVSRRTGAIEEILKRFKYDGEVGWAPILGRIIVGWLEMADSQGVNYDLITVNPSHADRQPIRHMELILAAARAEDQLHRWPLDDPDDTVLVKHTPTSSATAHGTTWRHKKDAADELWMAVDVVDPSRVAGRRILLVDDVTTTLLQLNVVAGILGGAGAAAVDGLVIARQGG